MSRSELDRRLRTISRVALYSSLVLVGGLTALLLTISHDPLRAEIKVTWADTDFASLDEVKLLQDYVRIDTSAKTGNVLDGARFLAGLLESEGIPVHMERVGDRDVNLWAILEGDDPGAVVLHSHIDVNDIDHPDQWEFPPFEAHLDPPWLYGRGAYDMKSVAIAQFLALRDLVRSGAHLRKSVIFLATSSEETGSAFGTRWIIETHPDLVKRFDLVLSEGGVVEARRIGNLKYYGVEFGQKQYWTLVACDASRDRLEQLREDLVMHGQWIDPVLRLPPQVKTFLEGYAPTRDAERLRNALSDPERILRDRPLFFSLPGFIQAMFRNELYPLRLRQVEDGGWELSVKIHLLPGVTLEDVRDEILPDWLFLGVDTIVYKEPSADHGSPMGGPVMDAIREAVGETYPEVPVGPMFLPWTATDSRFYRALGIPSYGFSPFPFMLTDVVRVNGPDERIGVYGYVQGVRIYKELLRKLVT